MAKKPAEAVRLTLPVIRGETKGDRLRMLWYPEDGATEEEKAAKWHGCKRCNLCGLRENDDIVFGDGNPDADVLILGDFPGEEEARTSYPFFGKSGRLLNQLLAATSDDVGIQELFRWFLKDARTEAKKEDFHQKMFEYRSKMFFITNTVGCNPPENATPTPDQYKACWPRIWQIIATVDPLLIITAGAGALRAVLGKKRTISVDRGNLFDATLPGRVGDMVYPTMPIFHPSYLLRKADYSSKDGEYARTEADLLRAFRTLDGLRRAHYGTPIPKRGAEK